MCARREKGKFADLEMFELDLLILLTTLMVDARAKAPFAENRCIIAGPIIVPLPVIVIIASGIEKLLTWALLLTTPYLFVQPDIVIAPLRCAWRSESAMLPVNPRHFKRYVSIGLHCDFSSAILHLDKPWAPM